MKFYYDSLRTAIEDMQLLNKNDVSDYSGILTIMDCAVNLLVAFDSDEREAAFHANWQSQLRGHGEFGFALCMLRRYAMRPWKISEAWYLLQRKRELFPEFRRSEYMHDGLMYDRTVVFSRAVWKFWGSKQMVIPDLATSVEKFVAAVERGNAVCRSYFRITRCTVSASGCARNTSRIMKCPASRPMQRTGLTAASLSR